MMLFHYNKFILFFVKFAFFCVISGGNRYIPAGGSGGPRPVDVTDPFTGASRYVPSGRSGVSDSVTSVCFIFFEKLNRFGAILYSLLFSASTQRSLCPF